MSTRLCLSFAAIFLVSCSDSSDPCVKSWQMLKNPRLDTIADETANLQARVASGRGSEQDAQQIQKLKREEDQIWANATNLCR
jgi:hypothetical protein